MIDVLPHGFVLGVDDMLLDQLCLLEVSHHEQQQILEFVVLWLGLEFECIVDGYQGLVVALPFLAMAEEEGSVLVPVSRGRLADLCGVLELPLSVRKVASIVLLISLQSFNLALELLDLS